jgi:transcription-repair coupling factor (superfamily II helicase)
VKTLVEFSLVKALAESLGVESVDRRGGFANLKFHKESRIDPQRLFDLVQTTAGAQFSPAGVLRVPLAEDVLQSMASTLRQLSNSA